MRFDLGFMTQVVDSLEARGGLERLIDAYEYRQAMIDNMGYRSPPPAGSGHRFGSGRGAVVDVAEATR